MKKLLLVFLFILFNCLVFAKPIDTGKLKNESGFIKNEGQIYDQNGNPNKQVLFLYTSPSLSVQLRDNGFSYEFRQTETSTNSILSEPNFAAINSVQKAHRIDIDFVGSNNLIEKIVCEQNEAMMMIHSKQNANLVNKQRSIKRILYKNVYPQTDIEFLVAEIDGKARFKYNIILHPGADESKLQFLIEGASKNNLTDEGSIAMHTSLGVLEEQVPLSYELTKQGKQGRSIGARFRQIHERLFGLTVDAKNRQNSLVIDPLVWSTYLGSTAGEYFQDICLDTLGNIYVVGQTGSNTDIATTGAHQTVLGGGSDGFIAKYTPAGILVWCTYYGGTNNDVLNALKVDAEQNILVAGQARSLTGIATSGTHSSSIGGSEDGILAKFSPSGNIIWGTYFGGLLTENFQSVYIDPFGDIIVAGHSNSDELTFSYPNIHQSTYAGTNDGLLVKFSTAGLVKWASFYGGSKAEIIYGVATDLVGNIYISGSTSSDTGIATPGSYKPSQSVANTTDGFMAKFNTLGVLKYGTY
ncbi:MAG: SBBP repeat-containing protein, partial [Bacteroidia bacterium]|nr:SBBP repeat-containing protein [Bacteroidia bacterium]